VQQVEGADGVLANPHLVLDLRGAARAHEIPLLTGVELSELGAALADVAVGELHLARELAVLVVEKKSRVSSRCGAASRWNPGRIEAIRVLRIRLERQDRHAVHLV